MYWSWFDRLVIVGTIWFDKYRNEDVDNVDDCLVFKLVGFKMKQINLNYQTYLVSHMYFLYQIYKLTMNIVQLQQTT